jgi:phage pi2 protein 07
LIPFVGAHLSVLKFDLMNFKMSDYRKDIFITEQEYQECLRKEIIHWNVSEDMVSKDLYYSWTEGFGKNLNSVVSLNAGISISIVELPCKPEVAGSNPTRTF